MIGLTALRMASPSRSLLTLLKTPPCLLGQLRMLLCALQQAFDAEITVQRFPMERVGAHLHRVPLLLVVTLAFFAVSLVLCFALDAREEEDIARSVKADSDAVKNQITIRIDAYLNRHTKASVSHGYCPECAAKAYVDIGVEVPERILDELETAYFD